MKSRLPAVARITRDLRNVDHLRVFALPIIERLAAWPGAATWGEWLDRFVELAPLVLSRPERVQAVLEQLRPMAAIGPVSLEEARDVIADRLSMLELDPPRARYGCVFVGSPQQARGRTFRVAFVPGLAERMFPQHPHEDPLMLDDEMRVPLEATCSTRTRGCGPSVFCCVGGGAPTERLWLSYPRLDTAESRPRVELLRARRHARDHGTHSSHGTLRERGPRGGARCSHARARDADEAIDDLEHDLAVPVVIDVDRPRPCVARRTTCCASTSACDP